jgi:hypothetical protein
LDAALFSEQVNDFLAEANMKLLNPLPGSRAEPAGLERSVLHALPAMLALGTLLPAAYVLGLYWFALGGTEDLMRRVDMARYVATGAILLNLMVVLHAALLAGIVVVMKGRAYVADAYPLPDSPKPQA